MVRVNTPLPHGLRSEVKKAAKILRDFSMPGAKSGPDKIIPAGILLAAHGLAIITVARAGFLVTARGGSGIVIAKYKYNEWSPPSAIGIAGLGGGFEVGVEVTDFVIILNTEAAVRAFSKGGNLTLGGNFTIAAGPLGRNVEGDISVRSPAAIYTYSKSKGLFAGISIEGSVLIERKDANRKFYGEDIRAYSILSSEVDRPPGCDILYETLEEHEKMFAKAALSYGVDMAKKQAARSLSEHGIKQDVLSKKDSDNNNYSAPGNHRARSQSFSTETHKHQITHGKRHSFMSSSRTTRTTTVVRCTTARTTSSQPQQPSLHKQPAFGGMSNSGNDWDKPALCKAKWDFDGQMKCDLQFKKGDTITILTRTGTQQDWWEGQCHGTVGIFPANYVTLL